MQREALPQRALHDSLKEKSITDRYSKMKERLELRKEWAEKAGLGFKLPAKKKTVTLKVKSNKQESAA